MIPKEPRRLGYYASKNWFQSAAVCVLLSVLAYMLIAALEDAKERAERQEVDLTVRNMRTGLKLAMGEAMMKQHERSIAEWVDGNPVQWLGSAPRGYRGECTARDMDKMQNGEWCFEQERHELVYRPNKPEHLIRISPDGGKPCPTLRWRVMAAGGAVDRGSASLRLEAVSGCRWELQGN